MFTRYILPLIAIAGIVAGVGSVWPKKPAPPPEPLRSPPVQPAGMEKPIYGAGLVEAQRENIPIGTVVPGMVAEVYVDGRPGYEPAHKRVGDRVRKGEPLFRIDDRDLRAELAVRECALRAAESQLHRLVKMPRPEDVPPAEAAVEEARARLKDAEAAYYRDLALFDKKMLAASDFDKDRYTMQAARATLAKAEADLAKLKAGSWKEDIDVQRAAVDQAKAQVEDVRIMLDRLTVRAPVDGQVLQVNIRPGQVATLTWKEPMIVLGEVNQLHVRVDVDENDLFRFREGVPATATLKGRKEPVFPLRFVRIEPYVIPKKSLTGDNTERVDTRVLQVLYALPDDRPAVVYVGQQMDVFLAVETGSDRGQSASANPPASQEAGPGIQ
ncbi:Multidrug resistance protein MdtN [Aquisphaera giovannonii]|uniref:Multidrug resistance protein MdtN n=1 Tax=Aquisphaera giovannonii TaxID=406548 RepID=A0A5B9W8M7_9BACT|nr:HlyD family efflux transporter periplasmic adaptor subunit [Aquisphaera giovannonii]QEH36270.1 Multidrug resistance protein MdtN [Aquisphaera giovannonii]